MKQHSMPWTLRSVLGLLLFVASGSVLSAGACTYSEAIMALERSNTVRGMALMRMAQRDGDERANRFFARNNIPVEDLPDSAKQQSDLLVSLNQAHPQ